MADLAQIITPEMSARYFSKKIDETSSFIVTLSVFFDKRCLKTNLAQVITPQMGQLIK